MSALESLQAKWRKANESFLALHRELQRQYGETWRAPAGKEKQLEARRERADKASDAVFAWLDEHSPRQWRTGCPCYWILEELTTADALTAGPLSVIPPCAYGYYPSDMVRFAAAVQTADSGFCLA